MGLPCIPDNEHTTIYNTSTDDIFILNKKS